jgi:hypothetical protein
VITRTLLGLTGCALAAYGVVLVLQMPEHHQTSLLIWLVTGVLAHDGLLAPAAVLLGWVGAHAVADPLRPAMVVGALVLGTVTLAATPVLLGNGATPANPTLLDRDYTAGWRWLAAIVVTGVGIRAVHSWSKVTDR